MNKAEKQWFNENFPKWLEHQSSSPQTLELISHVKESLEKLEVNMEKGFEGVHSRQDKTNGSVMKNTTWRLLVTGGLILTNIILIPLFFKYAL